MCNRTLAANTLIREISREDRGQIETLLGGTDHLYPGIEQWWRRRVLPELPIGRRVVLVAEHRGRVQGVFIGKKGLHAKLCTLRVSEDARGEGTGRALVTEGLRRLLDNSLQDIRVTVSEAADESARRLFEAIGFQRTAVERGRYVRGVSELVYSCARSTVVDYLRNTYSDVVEPTLFGVRQKTGHSTHQAVVLSLKPEFARMIEQGHKTVEFRRRFSHRHQGKTVIGYVTSPVRKFVFSAHIPKVEQLPTRQLWEDYSDRGGVSKAVFSQYFDGAECGFAIDVDAVCALPKQPTLAEAQSVMPGFRPPQSHQTLASDSPVLRLVGLNT